MADDERPGAPVAVAAPALRRPRLAAYLVPISAVVLVGLVTRAIWPTLLEEAPAVLLLTNSSVTRMLLVQPLVPAALFFAVGIARVMVLATLYWSFGREYGDSALRWSEEHLGLSPSWTARLDRGFRRAGRVLVVCWWSPVIAVLAGATGMRARVYFPLLALGTVGRVSVIYFVGDWLADPLTSITSFIGRYALYLTPVTIAVTVAQVMASRRRGRALPVGTIEELEEDFAETEAEVAGEATVTSPPERD